MAFAEGEVHAATSVERAITDSLELTAKPLGELVTHHQVSHANIPISTDYLELRQVIIKLESVTKVLVRTLTN